MTEQTTTAFWVLEGTRDDATTWRALCPFREQDDAERYAASLDGDRLVPAHFVEQGTVDPAFHPGFAS